MADKRISDLDITTSLEEDSLFVVRKTNQNEDFKITKSNLVKTIGNPVVIGFTAISTVPNKITLTPCNNGLLDGYYNDMIISFISPIASSGLVKIRIGTLEEKDFITLLGGNVKLKVFLFCEAVYRNNRFILTNVQISDFTTLPNNQLNADDLFLIRRPAENIDYKFTKDTLVNNLSNPAIQGFSAVGSGSDITLTPLNGATIPGYLDGMKISFLSPITLPSDNIVKIRIGSNSFVEFRSLLRLKTYPKMTLNNINEGVYKSGYFYKTNDKPNYTNETIGSGVISNNTTTYTLTSATGYYQTNYYVGMSVLLTSNIDSIGLVYINLDQLGAKLLSDPDGDGVPFSLVKNQTIMAIYDGTKFIKNSFTMREPEVPFTEITINVGPNQLFASNKTLQSAYDQIIKDYGPDGGGRQVTIQFDNDYNGEGLVIQQRYYNTGYIKIVGNPNVIMKPGVGAFSVFTLSFLVGTRTVTNLKLTGSWKIKLPTTSDINSYAFINLEGNSSRFNSTLLNFQDLIVENENSGNQNFAFISTTSYFSASATLNFNNVNIINFGFFNNDRLLFNSSYIYNLTYTNNINAIATKITKPIFRICGSCEIDGLNINITTPDNYNDNIIYVLNTIATGFPTVFTDFNVSFYLKNCNIILNKILGNARYIIHSDNSDQMTVILENCIIKYLSTVDNTVGSLYFTQSSNRTLFKILGSDFRNKKSSTIPDIITNKAELLLKTSTTLGSTGVTNGGKITVITE